MNYLDNFLIIYDLLIYSKIEEHEKYIIRVATKKDRIKFPL